MKMKASWFRIPIFCGLVLIIAAGFAVADPLEAGPHLFIDWRYVYPGHTRYSYNPPMSGPRPDEFHSIAWLLNPRPGVP